MKATRQSDLIMSRTILIAMLGIFCFSCNNQNKLAEQDVDTIENTVKVDTNFVAPKPTDRDQLMLEIERFKKAFTTKNKTEILSFFNFPLVGSSVNFFEVDSLFDEKRKNNDGTITKEMFSGRFNRIYEMTDMVEFNDLFANMNLELLRNQDNIKKEKRSKNEGCYYIYMISIKNDLVYFQYGTNSNDDYRKSHPDEEEICDEYAQMWTFKFDGQKLKFLTHRIAG